MVHCIETIVPWYEMQFTNFLKTLFSGCFEPLKKEHISNVNENSL